MNVGDKVSLDGHDHEVVSVLDNQITLRPWSGRVLARELRRIYLDAPAGGSWEVVAEWVEQNYTKNTEHASKLIDGEGDTWVHKSDGLYAYLNRLYGRTTSFRADWKTRDQIAVDYGGIRSEIR